MAFESALEAQHFACYDTLSYLALVEGKAGPTYWSMRVYKNFAGARKHQTSATQVLTSPPLSSLISRTDTQRLILLLPLGINTWHTGLKKKHCWFCFKFLSIKGVFSCSCCLHIWEYFVSID